MITNETPSTEPSIPDEVNRYAVFATLPPEQMLDVKALAYCLACSTRTVQRRARSMQLPPPIRMGNKSIWTVGQIRQWIDKLCRKVEAATMQEAARLRNFDFRS